MENQQWKNNTEVFPTERGLLLTTKLTDLQERAMLTSGGKSNRKLRSERSSPKIDRSEITS